MALKAIITSEEHGSLAEPIQAEYTPGENGQFRLDVEAVGGFDLRDVTGLTTALERERQNVSNLNKRLKTFGDLDPEAAREALQRVTELGDSPGNDQKAQAAYEAKLAELKKAHTNREGEFKEREATLMRELSQQMIEANAAMLMGQKDVGGNPVLLMPHVHREAKVVEDNGKFRVSVLDPSTGMERVSTHKDRAGQPMGLQELLVEMRNRQALAGAFAAPNATGIGSDSSSRGNRTAGGEHSISQQDARDPMKYRAAKAAAEKAGVDLQMVE